MAFVINDRVKETSTTIGTGTLDLLGASPDFESFVAGVGTGNQTYYAISQTGSNNWEVGIGTVTDAATDTLSRD
jgi:ethanolamine utilization protein EutA (predicted chaperonin)